ncbi:MAG: DNA polymerase III subunit delta, partial [Propionibacteriaceae bacterium]|nr:DNA polymerase III subunit delta [Propionibacteriaceae bacterium]
MAARFGTLTVVFGPDAFLAERAVARTVAELKAQDQGASTPTAAAGALDQGLLQELTGADLFATSTIAVVTQIERLDKGLQAHFLDTVRHLPETTALIVQHSGGNQGRGFLDSLKKLAVQSVECQSPKAWNMAQFVQREAQALHGGVDARAAEHLIDAVGADTRTVAAAVAQLMADSENNTITSAQVRRYFAGRADVTGFAVADDCLAGRAGDAIVKARWVLATEPRAHAKVTAALASSLRLLGKYLDASRRLRRADDISRAIGARGPWQVERVERQSRGWTEPAVAEAIRAVAAADANVKGAAGDPDYALEQAILKVSGLKG